MLTELQPKEFAKEDEEKSQDINFDYVDFSPSDELSDYGEKHG